MKKTIHALCLASSVLALLSGCSRDEVPPPQAVPIAEVPKTLDEAFKNANAESRTVASLVNSALQAQDDPRAFVELQALCADPNLTPEQREAASKAMVSVNAKLLESAANGDQRATEVLNMHRARK